MLLVLPLVSIHRSVSVCGGEASEKCIPRSGADSFIQQSGYQY